VGTATTTSFGNSQLAELGSLIKKPCYDRPFVCDGLPRSCDVVVIGENPATKMNSDWWDFWDDENGFNLSKFEKAYQEARQADDKPPISPTRLRLKRLRSNGLKCFETNFFSNEQLGGHGVGISSEDLLRTLIDHHHHGWKNCPVGLGIPCKIYGKRALPMRHSPKNFLASKEVAIHPHYRERLLRATEDVLLRRLERDFPGISRAS
jgi:hypothetical protein